MPRAMVLHRALVIIDPYDAGDGRQATHGDRSRRLLSVNRRMRREGVIGGITGVVLTTLVGIGLVLVLGIHTGSGHTGQPNRGSTTLPVRNGGSPTIQCGGDPIAGDRVIGLSKVSGSASCTTAALVLAHCGGGTCGGKKFTLEGDAFFCVSRIKLQGPPGASAVRSWLCTGPGQFIEWTDYTKGI
jgi:hypothetical protein